MVTNIAKSCSRALGEHVLLEYVANTQITAATFTTQGRHAGSAARVPGSGAQYGGPEPTLELRQRDPVEPGTVSFACRGLPPLHASAALTEKTN